MTRSLPIDAVSIVIAPPPTSVSPGRLLPRFLSPATTVPSHIPAIFPSVATSDSAITHNLRSPESPSSPVLLQTCATQSGKTSVPVHRVQPVPAPRHTPELPLRAVPALHSPAAYSTETREPGPSVPVRFPVPPATQTCACPAET